MKQKNKLLPGSLFCLLIGAAAWVMANYIPTVGKLIGGGLVLVAGLEPARL